MSRYLRAIALALLAMTALAATGCIHTWTQTYAEFPPSIYNTPHTHGQPDPADG